MRLPGQLRFDQQVSCCDEHFDEHVDDDSHQHNLDDDEHNLDFDDAWPLHRRHRAVLS